MQITNIHNAKTHFSKYIKLVNAGEEVVICSASNPVAKLIPYSQSTESRQPGLLKGKIKIASDFDELPDDFLKHFK